MAKRTFEEINTLDEAQRKRFEILQTCDRSGLTEMDATRYASIVADFRCVNPPDLDIDLKYFESILKPPPICLDCCQLNQKAEPACECACHNFHIDMLGDDQYYRECGCLKFSAHKGPPRCANCFKVTCAKCVTTCENCKSSLCALPSCVRRPIFTCDCKAVACMYCVQRCDVHFFEDIFLCPKCDSRCACCGAWACKCCLKNRCSRCQKTCCNTYFCYLRHKETSPECYPSTPKPNEESNQTANCTRNEDVH